VRPTERRIGKSGGIGGKGGGRKRGEKREKEEDRGSAHVGGIRKSTPADDRRSDVLPMGA